MKIKKIKFNAIDFLILLVIAAAVLSIALRSGLKDEITYLRSNDTIIYTVRINNVQKESFDYISSDDKLYSKKDDTLLGTVTGKSYRPAETYVSLSSGEIRKTYIPDRIDIMLTLECPGRVSEEGCMLDGSYFIASGSYITAYTDRLTFSFEVTNAYKKS